MRWLLSLLCAAACLSAQPVTIHIPSIPSISSDQRVEFRSAGPQTINPPADRFVSFPAGTLIIAPANLGRYAAISLQVSVNGTIANGTLDGHPDADTTATTTRLSFGPTPVSVGGVHISAEPLTDSFPLTGPLIEVPIRLRATRGNIVFGQDLITAELAYGGMSQVDIPLTLPTGSELLQGDIGAEFLGVGPGPFGARLSGYDTGSYRQGTLFSITFRASGLPPRTTVALVRSAPAPLDFRADPVELTFRLNPGENPQPIQNLVLTAFGGHKTIQAHGADSRYLAVAPSTSVHPGVPVLLPVQATPQNRAPGFVETTIPLFVDRTSQPVRVNLEIYDRPGSLTLTSSPGGTVSPLPNKGAYSNGDRVVLTAIPDRYYRFTGWSGSLPSTRNPLEVRVNGPLSLRAEFAFVGETPCAPTVSPTSVEAPPDGDIGRLVISAQPVCNWSVADLPSWVRVLGVFEGPAGSSTLSYLVEPNLLTTARTAALRIGAATIPVRQSPPSCRNVRTFPDNPLASAMYAWWQAPVGESGESCPEPWRASNSWLQPRGEAEFARVSISENPNSFPRTAYLYAGGFRLPVIQRGETPPLPFDDLPVHLNSSVYASLLKHYNVIEPCQANRFCPTDTLTRAAIAPWLIRAMLRTEIFPISQTPTFSDVPASHPQFRYIQKLAERGVTTGCGNGRYCPDRLITRGELAVFLIRAGARVGPGAVIPHPAKPFFRDVPEGAPFFAYIQKLRQWGATSGCTATDFCPSGSVTREQASILLVRTVLTPAP